MGKRTMGSILLLCAAMLLCSWTTARAEETVYLPLIASDPPSVTAAGQTPDGQGVRWRNHAAPWDFTFGNHKDEHQQSKANGKDQFNGFLYISYTGEMTKKGVPIATHTNCAETGTCTVGWLMHGIYTEAKLVAKGQGRPQWCIPVDAWPADNPAYTHFHWIRQDKGLGEAEPLEAFEGYLIKLTAVRTFAFGHEGSHGSGGSGGAGGPPDDTGPVGSHDGGCSGDDHDDGGCTDGGHDDGTCSGDEHGDTGGPPDDTGSGGSHDDSGCSGDDHDDGSCTDGDHDDGGCSGGSGQPKHIPVTPGIDTVTHANVTVCP